jgi:hypothetical protein
MQPGFSPSTSDLQERLGRDGEKKLKKKSPRIITSPLVNGKLITNPDSHAEGVAAFHASIAPFYDCEK